MPGSTMFRSWMSLGWIGLLWLGAGAAPWAAPAAERASETTAPIRFEEVGQAVGARIEHQTRSFGQLEKAQVLEMFTDGGSAAAVGDVDNDGDDDLFVVDAGFDRPHHLLLNDPSGGEPRFRDVAAQAGVAGGNTDRAICADALFFDYDNDGRLDLLVARFGPPLLYRNVGLEAGVPKFEEVGQQAGLDDFVNTIGVVTFDADGDGYLDLLLANYFAPVNLLDLSTTQVLPNNLDYADNGGGLSFYLNVAADGGGRRFVDRTRAAGFSDHTGWSLDVGHGDVDNDGDSDVYVAGDYGTDRLFLNRGDGTFEDVTEEGLGGFDTKKGMNVDFGDYDRDGFLDIYVTNITDEYMKECNMLWQNQGDGTYIDVSRETSTCDTDWGWAAKFADFDNDGWLDLVATNGLRSGSEENFIPVLLENTIIVPGVDFSDLHSYPDIGEMTWSGYQKQRLFRNLGDGTFHEIAGPAGIDNDLDGRGLAVGDFNLDGRLDVFQTNARQPSLLYLNRSANKTSWIGFRLRGTTSNRQAIGARLTIRSGEHEWVREVDGGNGYASASTPRIHVGLGALTTIDSVEIRWPGGETELFRSGAHGLKVGAYHNLVEGQSVQGSSDRKPSNPRPEEAKSGEN